MTDTQNSRPDSDPSPSDTGSDPLATIDAAVISSRPAPDLGAIGAYRLLRKLGEGGMGYVWLAEQTAPVTRQVAVKIIKAGRYDASALKRFELERQSLAIMNHPAIAKVFDAASTAEGQPYFVMEYVPGLPITTYCDQKRLTTRERLELFIRVCEGVQHAHQKAIMHRDLKPSNILVADVDGHPLPRIIDFGIAKATTPQSPDQTVFTHLGGMLGTPGYISPEQADPAILDVDTRTDVYSLGVILYEYDSCSALAADIRRYLENRPVLATPPSFTYRAGKFVRRNRTAVLAASCVVLMLFALAITMTDPGHPHRQRTRPRQSRGGCRKVRLQLSHWTLQGLRSQRSPRQHRHRPPDSRPGRPAN